MWRNTFVWVRFVLMSRSILLLIICLGMLNLATGQKFLETSYDVRDGLPQSLITTLIEDDLGYLWLGSDGDGLTCFDGTNFKTFTQSDGLLSNVVLSLAPALKGGVWIGGEGGVSYFNGKSFKTFEFDSRIRKVFHFYDTLLCFDQNFSVTKIYDDEVYHPKIARAGVALVKDVFSRNEAEYYVITTSDQLLYHSKKGVLNIEMAPGLTLYSVHFINGKTLVITNAGTFSLDSANRPILVEPRLNYPVVLIEDGAKIIWRRNNADLDRIVMEEDQVTPRTFKIDSEHFVGLKDSEGITWIGTSNGELHKYWYSEFEKIEGINGLVTSVFKDGNTIWVGTKDEGLIVIENNVITRRLDFSDKGSNRINAIQKDNNGKIWIAADVGLAYLDQLGNPVWHTRKNGLHSDSVNDIEFDANNRAWLTFKKGNVISAFDGEKFVNFSIEDSIPPSRYYKMVYAPELKWMLVASNNSVVYIENDSVKRLSIPSYNRSVAYSISVYKKEYLVIGYAVRGIALLNLKTNEVRHYGRMVGSSTIYFTGTDAEDYIWIGHDLGIDRFNLGADLEVNEFVRFGLIHDASNRELSFRSYFVDDQEKYFGLSNGLYHFGKSFNLSDQKLHLLNVELFFGEDPIRLYSDSLSFLYQYPIAPKFPSDKNHLTFSFLKINKLDPQSVSYKYMLEGFETKWGPPTSNQKVTYSSLPPGKYVFKVLSRDKDGIWANDPLQYGFEIEKPIYQTTGFITFGIISFILLGVLFFYFRLKYQVNKVLARERFRQEENARLRKEIGRDFHDEMGNQLARIINYAGLVRLKKNDVGATLIKIEDSAKELITGTKDFIWALDPANEIISNLFVHVRDFGVRLFKDSKIDFRPSYLVTNDIKLPYGFGRQINLILKESLTNVFKHSHASYVDLIFSESEGKFVFEVNDDGVGVTEDIISQSEGGIANIAHRATKMGGSLSITNNNSGTNIKLIVECKDKP